MGKRKDMITEEERNTPATVKHLEDESPAAAAIRRQDLSLTKGERQKGVSPAYAVGKKLEAQERKRNR